jgi:SAM-dependent methyltransferase
VTMTASAKRWLGPWLGPLREWRAFRRRRAPVPIDVAIPGGHVDSMVRSDDGVLAVFGWCDDLDGFERMLHLRVGGASRSASHVFRVPRPDVEGRGGASRPLAGAVAEWLLDAHAAARDAVLLVNGRDVAAIRLPPVQDTPYRHLHAHPQILGRDGIYAFGPPNRIVSDEVLHLARQLPGPVLDFGCGAGAPVRALRQGGVDAFGLEIDEARIRQHLFADVQPFVTLYDGSLPTRFGDRQFASVVCSEVLEHVAAPDAAIAEIARLAARRLMVTVPDMSAIPRGYAHGVVPWHLLESTHINFFTHYSLKAALAPYTSRIEMARIGLVQCDRIQFYGSLVALASVDRA